MNTQKKQWFEKMQEHIDFEKKIVLDLGCGDGEYGVLARDAYAKLVTGIDEDIDKVRNAKKASSDHGYANEIFLSPIEEFQFPRKYDIVIMDRSIHTLVEPESSIPKFKDLAMEYVIYIYRAVHPDNMMYGSFFPEKKELDTLMTEFSEICMEFLEKGESGGNIYLIIYKRI